MFLVVGDNGESYEDHQDWVVANPNSKVLTELEILKALEDAAAGANELNEQLKDVFELTATSASLRLR